MEDVWPESSALGHICKRYKEEVIVESNVPDERYKCGGCSQELRTICQLHEHLLKEFLLGSYLYDHSTKTAYPKLAFASTETQTDENDYLNLDDRSNGGGRDSERVAEDTKENLGFIQQDDEIERVKTKRKRKYLKRKEEADFEIVSKKKAKSKSSKILKTEPPVETVDEGNTKSNMLETITYSPETISKQEYDVKDEALDCNYDGSTDDNIDNFNNEIEKVVAEHSENNQSVKKRKKNVKKKSKTGAKKNRKVKNYVKNEVLKGGLAKNDKKHKHGDTEVKNVEFPDNELNGEGNGLTDSACDIKQRGRPKAETEVFTCEQCDSVFYNEKQYNTHFHSAHKAEYPFSCKQCNYKPFRNKKEYVDHRDQHPKIFFHCELCGKELKSREGLRLHELIHSGEKPYCCDQCDYKGRTSTQLRQHMYTHMDSKTEQCELCGKAFFTKGKLKEHLRYCRKEFNHHCPHCQKGFPTASGLRKHILMHTGERAFVCDVCGFATFRITLLNSHMRTHTGEKPHKCKECGAQLATRGTLLLHLRTHTHEKPFVCSYCSKAFTSKWNLQTHLRQHTGETPYKCDICGQGFKQNVLRKSHMRSHLESTSIEPDTSTHLDLAPEPHVAMDTDTKEHSAYSHLGTTETKEPVYVLDKRLEPGKLNLNNFVYDRSSSGDILSQALHSENLHPLDLKLHYTSASDIKNVYNNSFEMMNYQDVKHV